MHEVAGDRQEFVGVSLFATSIGYPIELVRVTYIATGYVTSRRNGEERLRAGDSDPAPVPRAATRVRRCADIGAPTEPAGGYFATPVGLAMLLLLFNTFITYSSHIAYNTSPCHVHVTLYNGRCAACSGSLHYTELL